LYLAMKRSTSDSSPSSGEELTGIGEDFLAEFPVDEFPDVDTYVRQHLVPRQAVKSGFEFVIDLLLDGLERAETPADYPTDRASYPRPDGWLCRLGLTHDRSAVGVLAEIRYSWARACWDVVTGVT
jgi:hypothetical protein